MFESAEPDHKIDKATYDKEVPLLRVDPLDSQFDVDELKKCLRSDDCAPISWILHSIPTSGGNPQRGGGSGVK